MTPTELIPRSHPVFDALTHVYEGTVAGELESETLDFKEDPAVNPKSKNPDAHLVEVLADESVCLANGEASHGWIVLGVNDKSRGPEAFTGTDRDPAWLERKIFNNTHPNMRVECNAFTFNSARIIVIRIPQALTLYTRTKGQGSHRVGTDCVPLTEESRRAISLKRLNPDFSAMPSSLKIEDIKLTFLDEARRLLRMKRQLSNETIPETNEGLLRELDLFVDGSRGTLTRAAEILFASVPNNRVVIRHLWRAYPGAEPASEEISEPIITALETARMLVKRHAASEITRIAINDSQEIAIPAFPITVIDEVLTNAVVHRDWDYHRPIVIEQSPGILKVSSPGPLPYGVTVDNVLSTRSIPRNPRLMNALRILNLVEESSRGFDRMWVAMLSTGRDAPVVRADSDSVTVTIAAGNPDEAFVKGLYKLSEDNDAVLSSLHALIVLWHLYRYPLITLADVVEKLQVNEVEARDTMAWMETQVNVIQKIRDAEEWALSESSLRAFGLGRNAIAAVSIQEWLEAKLRSGDAISAREAAEELGTDRIEITKTLDYLRHIGRAQIDPSGPQRGSNVKWIKR